MQRVIKYFSFPTFTATQWSTRNPLLEKGEVGYLLDSITNEVTGMKVGPGRWNDLPLLGSDIYPYADVVTNPIGDAKGNLQGNPLADILKKMLNPYQVPQISQFLHNIGAGNVATSIREIGQALAGPVAVTFTLSNSANLLGATPVNVTAGGVFSNEGNFAFTLPISLNLAVPFNPSSVTTITLKVKVTHQEGETPQSQSLIHFYPKLMWCSSPLDNLSGAQFMAVANRVVNVNNNYKRDYVFQGNGYSWLAIPSMLNPTNLVFTDVTNPSLPANYSFESKGIIAINNGVTTYNYNLYRSTFNLINPTTLRVS
jgi:hypothetical protein